MKTILVATDFSIGAENATIYAVKYASEKSAKIILFHLYHISIHAQNSRMSASSMDELVKSVKNKHSKKAKRLSEEYDIEVLPVLSIGDFQEELNNAINSTNADIVVMGMPKKSLEQDILGNTTTLVLQSIKIPLLAVPLNAVYKGLKNILFACDIKRGIHKTIFERVQDISNGLGAEIEVFHASRKTDHNFDEQDEINILHSVEQGLHGTNYSYKNVESDKVIEAIKSEISRINADLLIMIPYRYGFWGSFVHRSKTRIMISNSEIPLLSLPL
ncbi:hypothetical protein AM493_06550 [Flavobacterium akiainvivens]|uniref:UspA domain-containing protein n=1 Tax=Flavobacterium akiainvivens TaxID=1202724 RepID=A0A0M8MA34_9FLAO|nr:universal stress protein [Flavobacterium akiainvivens]KOS05735.1 hypothetical protein AM493_06550 [Flavobacterium akiainvivens]SFQ37583.1 Nucleotide-binding universal stress protein, UspA family [Flavobacterium akiainvivens]